MKLFGTIVGCMLMTLSIILLAIEMLGTMGYFEAQLMWGIELNELYHYLFLLIGTIIFGLLGLFLFYVSYMLGMDITEDVDLMSIFKLFLGSILLMVAIFAFLFFLINTMGWSPWIINGINITHPDLQLWYLLGGGLLLILGIILVYYGYIRPKQTGEFRTPTVPTETLETISKMAVWAGMDDEQLKRYVHQRYHKELNYLNINEVEDLINDLKMRQDPERKRKSR